MADERVCVVGTLPERSAEVAAVSSVLPVTRLSDADREHAVALLNDAVADGRLTWPEHAERVEQVWAARTSDQLAPHVADLGVLRHRGEPQRVVARLGKIIRKPEPGRRVEAWSWFGAVYLDLSELADGEELLVEASSFCGKVVLTVPADATVLDEGDTVLGKRKILVSGSRAEGGPLIRITGRSTLGHLKVFGAGVRWW
jgi:hypothetical protein